MAKAGRPKGAVNRRSLGLAEKAEKLKIDPFEILLLFANGDWKRLGYGDRQKVVAYSSLGQPIYDDVIPPELRQRAAADSMPFLHAKRKAIEIEAGVLDGPISITLDLDGCSPQSTGTDPAATKAHRKP